MIEGRDERRYRVFMVSRQLLEEVLLLPKDSYIIDISRDVGFMKDQFAFKVESLEFDPVPPDCIIPTIEARYSSKPIFVGWVELGQ